MELLPQLFDQILLPSAVHDELVRSNRFTAERDAFAMPWLRVIALSTPVEPFLSSQLDPGEAAVLTLARETTGAEVPIDERRGRRVADQVFGLRIVGSGRLLLRAKAMRLIPSVTPLSDAMVNNGYHLNPRLVHAVPQAAGESVSS